jgi:hypothetical protein
MSIFTIIFAQRYFWINKLIFINSGTGHTESESERKDDKIEYLLGMCNFPVAEIEEDRRWQ